MKLPGGATASIEISKLRDYCLDPHHPRGRHKARVFLSALGLGQGDANFLMTHRGREATVRSAWIILRGESAPQLSSFVL